MSLHLSKSKYCTAVQCPKILWLREHLPEEADETVTNEALFETGNQVGDLAMGLFGDFVEVPFGNLSEMIKTTREFILTGEKVIAEASFSFEGAFCSVDILKNLGDNQVEIYEVKSSSSVKEIHYDDIAFQYYVLTNLGYKVLKACIIHINTSYVRKGELELDKLFKIEDVTSTAEEKQGEVKIYVEGLPAYVAQPEEPDEQIGYQCFDPYACPFFAHCTKDLPKPNVFDLAGVRLTKKLLCYYDGFTEFGELWAFEDWKPAQQMQLEHEFLNLPPHIDKVRIIEFLSQLFYPIYFLDFESYQPAIPQFDHSKPYEQIVFQYSLHYIEHKYGELKHKAFLAYPGKDPRRELAEQLCKDIPMDVCVTAYNKAFERTRLKELAELYPDLREHLMNIHDNIIDLMVPFQKKHYYCKEMQGSYSIKYVLPALFPNVPELDYHNLEGVHNGAEASATFLRMATMDKEKLETYRRHLLEYCKLDTLAMVKIWEKLHEVIE